MISEVVQQSSPISAFAKVSTEDRRYGSMLGLAVGDALGTTLTMMERDKHPPIRDIIGGGPLNLPAGAWTDDTAMALALADSLQRCGGFDAKEVMDAWMHWLEHGEYSATGKAIDIGKTILRRMMEYRRTGQLVGTPDERMCGNGSIMRLAPLVAYYADDPQQARAHTIAQTNLTHPSTMAVEAGILMCDLLLAAYGGADKASMLATSTYAYTTAMGDLARGAYRSKPRDAILSGGYVLESLEAALWSFATTDSFEDALLTAVHLCGDSDTVGAITGQLAGAFYGAGEVPQRWREVLGCK